MLSILEVLPWSVHTIVRVVDQEDENVNDILDVTRYLD